VAAEVGDPPSPVVLKAAGSFLRRFRFTRIGGRFVGITLLVSIAAFNTGNNPLYLVLGMLLSLILLSGMLSELTLKDLEVSRQLPSRIFAGQPVLVGLTLVNRKRRLPSFSLQVSERIEGLRRADWPSSYVLRLDPGAKLDTFYQHTFSRRGAWRLQGFEIATSFPFELFRKAVEIEDAQTVIVFPRPAPVQVCCCRISSAAAAGCALSRARRGTISACGLIVPKMMCARCTGRSRPNGINWSCASWSVPVPRPLSSVLKTAGSRGEKALKRIATSWSGP
jgi:hypothetical protein